MNTRTVLTSAMVVIAAWVAGCSKQQASPESANTAAPGMGYEAHVAAGGIAPPAVTPPRAPASASSPKAGEGLFSSMNCDGCHGGGATGWEGPSLVDGRWRYGGADEEIFQSIFYGRPKGMPAYGGVLGSEGVWMIVSYLKSQRVPAVVPTTNYEELDKPATQEPVKEATPPAPSTESNAPTDPRARLAQYGCIACHAVDKKIVGPAFSEVAAKYHDQAGVAQKLEEKVKNGGVGVWGNIPMPPNSAVPDTELHDIVNWILTSPEVRK